MGSQVHDKDELITISEKNDMIHDEAEAWQRQQPMNS